MNRQRMPGKTPVFLFLTLALILFLILAISVGRYGIPVEELLRALSGREGELPVGSVLFRIRLPRILFACLVGAALSVSGTAYQTVFQNPMAAPDILGASSGAAFGAALGILLRFSSFGILLAAFFFGLITVALVYFIAGRSSGMRRLTLLLAGMMISALFSAGTSAIKLLADPNDQLPAITYWLMGSLSGHRWRDFICFLPAVLLGMLPLFLLRWRLNLLSLSDEEIISLGTNPELLRFLALISATLLTAASVSVSGMIGWVGLLVPHLSRKIVGNDMKKLLPASLLLGASFLTLLDTLARNLLVEEIPIGLLTAFLGAPLFLLLLTGKEYRL